MSGPVIKFYADPGAKFQHGSPTLRRYLMSDAAVRICQGPVESGKTVASIAALYVAMCTMPRCKDGIRRSRWLLARRTYPELETSLRRDWGEWFPEDRYGKISADEPFTQTMRFLDVEAEIVMMSFPDATTKTLKKLRSTQFTGALVNEGQYFELRLVTEIIDRTGRYPRKIDCPDYKRRKFLAMDMNAPPDMDHWTLYMRGELPLPEDMPEAEKISLRKPADWEFFIQPPAIRERLDENGNFIGWELHPEAENLHNMGDNPYLSALGGKTQDQIDRDFRNVTRAITGGNARYPQFSRDHHVARGELKPYDGGPIRIGIDPGGNPGFTMGQLVDGRWYVLHAQELQNTDSSQLAERILYLLTTRFPFYREQGVIITGDPAGAWGTLNSRQTTQQIFSSAGLPYEVPASKDKPDLRLSMGRRVMEKRDKLVICPVHCRDLILALDGGMVMKDGKLEKKSLMANVGESFEYMLWGGGEAREIIARPMGERPKPINTIPKNASPYGRGRTFPGRPGLMQ